MERSKEQSDSFVVRVWRAEGKEEWWAWVQHARSGEAMFVRDVDALWAFIEHKTGHPKHKTPGGLK